MATASASENVPAATCAEYSPRLCPATNAGSMPVRREHAAGGDADGENRRLRVLGQRQLILGAVGEHARAATRRQPPVGRGGERRVGLGQRGVGLGKGRGERHAHADLLRALPGKHEGDAAAHDTPATATPRVTCATTSLDASRAAMAMALRMALADERPCATMAVPATPSSGAPPYSE